MNLVVVDDHQIVRDGLRAILEKAGMVVVGEAANGREGVEVARRLKPDVVLMDVSMPDLNGIDATRQIVADRAGAKVIGLSMNADRRYVTAMFKAGAVGYLLKNSAAKELLSALDSVGQNLTYVSPAVASTVLCEDATPASSSQWRAGLPGPGRALSPREREVLQLLAEGKSSKEMANVLHLAVATVETHRRQLMGKLGLHTVAELTKYALREGITSAE